MRHVLREGAVLLATGVLAAGCGAPKTPEYDASDPSTWSRKELIGQVAMTAETICENPTDPLLHDKAFEDMWPYIAKATNDQHMLASSELKDYFASPYVLADGQIAPSIDGLAGQLSCTTTFVIGSEA